MTRKPDAGADIVWPDEEHLFDVDTISMDDRAGSQTSDGWNGLHGSSETRANESKAELSGNTPSANDYWDHDDRNVDANALRSVSPPRYGLNDEDSEKWTHDKFDLLKIGPPPGLDIRSKTARFGQRGFSGPHQHQHQQQTIRRGQQSTVRVLEVPRPIGVGPGLHGRRLTEYQIRDELRPVDGEKIPWPDEVRDGDADMWGWPEDAQPGDDPEAGERQEAEQTQITAASRPSARPRRPQHEPKASMTEQQKIRQPKAQLPAAEQQNLRQVEQRNSEMAAIFAQLKVQEQMRQAVQAKLSQQAFAHASGAMHSPVLPGSSALRPPFHLQSQLASSPFQHLMPAVSLTPGFALHQQQHGISLAPNDQPVRTTFSHLAHAQPAQSLQPPVQPGQPAHMSRQAGFSQAAKMPAAAFMNGPRAGVSAPAASPRAFSLKPGHLGASQAALSNMQLRPASPAVTTPAPAQHPFQPNVQGLANAPVLPKRETKRLEIVDPKSRPANAEMPKADPFMGRPGRHGIAIVDPHSTQQISTLTSSSAEHQLNRSDSTSSSGTGKKLIAIVDPNNKQPIQLPPKTVGASRLARSSSSISVASSEGQQPVKRTLAIVDPQNKQPVALPELARLQSQQTALADGTHKRTKTPLAIMDPVTSAQVQLPDSQASSTTGKLASQQALSRPVRARRPLEIVDPKPKGQSAASIMTAQGPTEQVSQSKLQRDEASHRVSVGISVADDSTVQCSMNEAAELKQHELADVEARSMSSSMPSIKLSLIVHPEEMVTCHIALDKGQESTLQ